MSSHRRFSPFPTLAKLLLVGLLLGCPPGGPRAFHYPEGGPKPPDFVEIRDDCQAGPEVAVIDLDAGLGKANPRSQVLWVVAGKQPGDRVLITAKAPEEQDPKDRGRGKAIHGLFQAEFEIPQGANAIRSGNPKKALALLPGSRGSVTWKYNIEYYRAGKKLCAYDPEICIQKLGSSGCGVTAP